MLRSLFPAATIFALRSGTSGEFLEGVKDIARIQEMPGTCDLAVIATPTFLHKESIQSVLPLRPFFFVEKPLALTVEDATIIVRDIEQGGRGSYVGCPLRFHPCLLWIREALGRHHRPLRSVSAVCASWLPDWQPGRDFRKSFRMRKAESGGVHLELIHELDYVTWLFGQPASRTVTLRKSSDVTFDAPDEAHYELHYPDFPATIDLSCCSKDIVRRLTITFTDGEVWMADLLDFTVRTATGDTLFSSKATMEDVYEAQMRHVLDCVVGRAASLHPVRDALETLTLALS